MITDKMGAVRGLIAYSRQVYGLSGEEDAPVSPLILLQKRLRDWQHEQFGDVALPMLALGVAEEAGELCHAVLKRSQLIRGMENEDNFIESAGDAIADAAIYLINTASNLGLDFESLLFLTATKVMKRNWLENKADGTNPTENP